MLPYLIVAAAIGLVAIMTPMYRLRRPLWILAFGVLIVFVGFRHKVGMDWNNYLILIYKANFGTLAQAFSVAEPSYSLLLWISGQLGWGVYGPNFAVAIILMTGLFRYARTTPSPWIALSAAMPFLVIVTAMSANRQAAAIGVLLWAIAGWSGYSIARRVALIAFAATFHASAVILLAFVVADLKINRVLKGISIGIAGGAALYYLSVTDRFEYYDQTYGSGQSESLQSPGAVFHVLINAGPGLFYFAMRRRFPMLLPNDLHRQMAALAVLLIGVAFVTSIGAGRMSLYLFPVSMQIFAAIPGVLHAETTRLFYRIGCVLFFLFVLGFWLLYSNSGFAYLPYQNLFTIDPWARHLCC